MMRFYITFFLVVCFGFSFGQGQSPSLLFLENNAAVSVMPSEATSIYKTEKTRGIPPLGLMEVQRLDRSMVPSFDRISTRYWNPTVSKISDKVLLASALSPLALGLDKNVRNHYGNHLLQYGTVLGTNYLLTHLTKRTVKRTRPYVYNPEAPLDRKLTSGARVSFFSGHTSTTAASTFFFAKTYADYNPGSKATPYVWATSAIIPAAVGAMRIRSGKHFPSDVIVGYIVGAAIGILVPKIYGPPPGFD